MVSSLALESLASAIDGVVEAAALGVPDAKWGERPLLPIVADDCRPHGCFNGA